MKTLFLLLRFFSFCSALDENSRFLFWNDNGHRRMMERIAELATMISLVYDLNERISFYIRYLNSNPC